MIFLFQYQTGTEETYESSCPEGLWFANQVPDNACATVALLNIINNIPDVKLGNELLDFKETTRSLSPFERGEAIDDFHHVKIIHNSFAREIDMLESDLSWKRKQAKARTDARKRKAGPSPNKQPAKKAKLSLAASNALPNKETGAKTFEDTDPLSNSLRRSGRTRKQTAKYQEVDTDDNADVTTTGLISEEGYHFIAYMPIRDEVWRLDGMDPFPQNLGRPEDGQDWLSIVKPALQARMAQYAEGQIEFSLMAVVQDPILDDRDALAANIQSIRKVELALDKKNPEWKRFLHHTVTDGHDQKTCASLQAEQKANGAIEINGPNGDEKGDEDDTQQPKAAESHEVKTEQDRPEEGLIKTMSIEYGISEADIASTKIPDSIEQQIVEGDAESLLALRTQLVTQQAGCRHTVRDEMQTAESDREQVRLRRHDFKPFFSTWIASLKDEELLKTVVAKTKTRAK